MGSTGYETERDEEAPPSEDTSLEGKGWDILVGGKENLRRMGGEDFFDLIRSPDSDSPAPTEEEEIDLILKAGAATPAPGEAPPEEAFWDRGRGPQAAEEAPALNQPVAAAPRDLSPQDLAGVSAAADSEPPPRDLSPEELAALAGTAPVVGEDTATEGLPLGEPGGELTGPLPEEPEHPPEATTPESEPVTAPASRPAPSAPPEEPVGGEVAPLERVEGSPETLPRSVSAMPLWPMPEARHGGGGGDPFERPPFSPGANDLVLPPDEDIQDMLVTRERIQELWEDINETYDQLIRGGQGYTYAATDRAISELREARELLVSGPDNFDEAERLVAGVRARLRREEKAREWTRKRGPWLSLYLVAWLLALLLGVVFLSSWLENLIAPYVPDWIGSSWLTAGLFGSLGGTVGAFWVLIKHTAIRRDFDPVHTPWYLSNPFMGYFVGVLTALIVSGGGSVLSTVAGVPSSAEPGNTGTPLLYVLSLAAGFNQNVLWQLIDRLTQAFIPGTEDEGENDLTI